MHDTGSEAERSARPGDGEDRSRPAVLPGRREPPTGTRARRRRPGPVGGDRGPSAPRRADAAFRDRRGDTLATRTVTHRRARLLPKIMNMTWLGTRPPVTDPSARTAARLGP
ncbi:hypothetical protein [Streptomyces sp. bgisy032]|uniref:hypothetical protein n=1 Tax=Streptomyces sp. bgisy032 TaxID=3413773 RepID=UPI003D74014A